MPPRIKANRRKKNTKLNQLPFQEIQNPFKPMELISADQIEFIHKTSLKVLSEIGIRVDSLVALKLLKEAGAEVNKTTNHVKFEPALVEEMLKGIPSEFTIHARNPQKTLKVGGNSMIFATVCGPSFVTCHYK